jgi:polyketide synthase 12
LLVPASYFTALAECDARISGVRVELKAGAARNEMTRFRYDATLAVGEVAPDGRLPVIDGSTLDQEAIERIVKDEGKLPCRIARLRNARLAREASVLVALTEDAGVPVRALLNRTGALAVDPSALAAAAKRHGCAISIQPSPSGRVEEFDAILWAAHATPPSEIWNSRLPGRTSGPRHALNLQLRLRMERQLTQALLKSLEPTLDKAEPRPNIVLVDELPAD